MTPSQQTIQLIRDAIVSGNLQDAEKVLEKHCNNFFMYVTYNDFGHDSIRGFFKDRDENFDEIYLTNDTVYQLFNQSK